MRQHRMFGVLLLFTAAIGVLGFRLLWLQTVGIHSMDRERVAARAVAQRMKDVIVDSGRGQILDRSGVPLTGEKVIQLLLLPGGLDPITEEQWGALAEILHTKAERLISEWSEAKEPVWWSDGGAEAAVLNVEQSNAIQRLGIGGAVPVESVRRYPRERLAAHAVGFLAEQPERVLSEYGSEVKGGRLSLSTPIGAAGIERAFDRYLLGRGGQKVAVFTGIDSDPLEGLGIRTVTRHNQYYPLRLMTTLDAGIQREIERAADRLGLESGSVVVLDAETGDTIAMVSRPNYEPHSIDLSSGSWSNRGLHAIAPGSVMKTFIAAVALEEGAVKPNETFECDGSYEKYGLTCWKKHGHGRLTFEQALAQSCNLVFAQIGERLSGEMLQHYAEQVGLSGTVGWSGMSAVNGAPIVQFPEEEPSRLFAFGHERGTVDGGTLAQTSIGQRDVRWTPLAAANWMVTLLQNGTVATPRIASELRYADGRPVERYKRADKRTDSEFSPATAARVRAMMNEVVTNGTGALLKSADWPLAGKSGTAQTTVKSKPRVHQWFVGYGPSLRPKYAAAVTAENRMPDDSHLATALFKEVMDILAAQDKRQ